MQDTILAHGYAITLKIDELPDNPRVAWDSNAGIMACSHRRYTLGDKDGWYDLKAAVRSHDKFNPEWEEYYVPGPDGEDVDNPDYIDLDDKQALIDTAGKLGMVILPLYLMDHSGISMSTGDYGDPWDSGMVGVIFCPPDVVRREWGDGPDAHGKALKCLETEVETYSAYLEGDVWGFIISLYVVDDSEDGYTVTEELESCWGFYGFEYAKREALDTAKSLGASRLPVPVGNAYVTLPPAAATLHTRPVDPYADARRMLGFMAHAMALVGGAEMAAFFEITFAGDNTPRTTEALRVELPQA